MTKCDVCKLADSKYRCPVCRILYCSVGCYKTHKDSSCEQCKPIRESICDNHNALTNDEPAVKEIEPGEVTDDESDNEDKVGQEKLSLLENSQTIKSMLANEHLQRILKSIDEQENGEKELECAMRLPLFSEFANECLKVVDDSLEKHVNQS